MKFWKNLLKAIMQTVTGGLLLWDYLAQYLPDFFREPMVMQ